MKTSITFLASFACLLPLSHALVSAQNRDSAPATRRGCLNEERAVTDSDTVVSKLIRKDRLQSRQAGNSSINLDVHFHIASSEAEADLITDNIVAQQFSVLHDAYAAHNIFFTLASTDRVVDNLTAAKFFGQDPVTGAWTTYDEQEAAYFKATRKGGYGDLNLYFFTTYLPGATGYCNWPTAPVTEGDDTFINDGCQLSAKTMPGLPVDAQEFSEWNMGHMAVHETGHWFGLNHTFAGGCSDQGDFVADTPGMGLVYGCPIGSDTCPGVAGLDPIHNYMGYTDDNCTNEFTAGQADRMFDVYQAYRQGK